MLALRRAEPLTPGSLVPRQLVLIFLYLTEISLKCADVRAFNHQFSVGGG